MFSIQHPSIITHLGQMPYGLQPVFLTTKSTFSLLLKATKEAILTARLNKQVKIYLIPDNTAEGFSLGLITAFFDEHDREMMGVDAHVQGAERFRQTISSAKFQRFDLNGVGETLKSMCEWFGQRSAADDERAFIVKFESPLYPDDLMIIDARPMAYDFQGAEGHPAITSLERSEPGAFQERDLVHLLRRSFPGESIFLNPMRTDTETELADVICVTKDIVLLVQAKDSPNTEASLRRNIDRKRAVIRAHIEKGAKQLRGVLAYVSAREKINIRTSSGERALDIGQRLICGLVIVREMFDDDYAACSAPVLTVGRECRAPCILLDYAGIHIMTMHLAAPDRLLNGLCQLYDLALENGEYSKPRFLGQPHTAG